MKQNRRSFFKKSALAMGVATVGYPFTSLSAFPLVNFNVKSDKKMKLTYSPFRMELKHRFTGHSLRQ